MKSKSKKFLSQKLKGLLLLNYALFSLFTFSFSQPVSSPDMKCLSVAGNGDVTLYWTAPADTGSDFISYNIYSSFVAAGPYTQIATLTNYSLFFYSHIGAGANANRVYYLIRTDAAPSLSAPKDTFSTIFLTVGGSGSGTAALSWNKISFQNIPTQSNWYKIYREYPIGNWTLLDSTTALTYTDIITLCSDSLTYRIEIYDSTGCTSVSNLDGGTFYDNTPPVTAPIDTVSVNILNLATISWEQSPSADADSVVIYRWSPGWQPLDTVPVLPAFYTNPTSTAGTASERYSIAFLDSCDNISPIGTEHRTIFLSVSFDVCAATASLQWNKYINWSPAVTQYQVYVSVNGGNFSFLTSTSASDTDYVHTGLLLGNNYCYLIRATNGTKTSSSNRVCGTLNVSQPPVWNYARYATVLSSGSIQITAYVDPAAGVKYFRIKRATKPSGSFSVIPTNLIPAPDSMLTYTDNAVNTAMNSYAYLVEAIDSCENVLLASNTDSTILLEALLDTNLDIVLSWNDYGSYLGAVDHYDIYRAVDGVWESSPFASVPYSGSGAAYTDNPFVFFSTSRGNFSYYVMAVEGSGNTFGFRDSSRSNVVKVQEYPKIYVPNCFTPNGDGVNDVFMPVAGFIDAGNYSFSVFDNTGTPVFSTTDITQGWDGKKKRNLCPEGVYVYMVSTLLSSGEISRLAGTVTLIR